MYLHASDGHYVCPVYEVIIQQCTEIFCTSCV